MKHFSIGVLFVLISLLTGCNIPIGEDGESVEISKDGATITNDEGKEAAINIDKDEGSMTISGEDGDLNIGVNSEIPEGFPSDIPIPDDITIVSSASIDNDTERGSSVNFLSDGNYDDIVKLYSDYFASGDFENIADGDSHEGVDQMTAAMTDAGIEMEVFMGQKANESYVVSVQNSPDLGGVNVSITHSVIEK
ncbi:hypothetical protein ACLIBH_00790 [Virgibacillus sp. W0430]|uniref:hypothetical protein n=1 Tax=Virgibacillus sp. W0430 TaxID=3391580 RepID=UPI003F45BBB0